MIIYSKTTCFIFYPFSFVDVSVGVDETTFSVGFVVQPETFVFCPVGPDLDAETISHFVYPVPRVYCTRFELVGHFGIIIIFIIFFDEI
jgi:hypothetical protein